MMNRKTLIAIIMVSTATVAVFLLCGFLFYSYNQKLNNKYFTIVVLPDTQNYSSNYPDIFKSQTKWIADNIEKENIVFAVAEGDIVNNYNIESQWQNAKSAYDLIKGKLPLGLLLGNHDMAGGKSPLFEKYFPFAENKNYSWEGNDFPAGTGYNSFQLFSAGKEKYISVDLSLCPTNDVVAWANNFLKQYSDRKAIITTHGFIDGNAERNVWCANVQSNTQYIWDKIVFPNTNVFLVLSGHMHAEAMRVDKNSAGNNVFQLLADYQSRENGGEGWMRLLEFNPAKKEIHVKTYSPYLDKYETDPNSDFVLNY